MMTLDQLTRDFTQYLIQSIVTTALGFMPQIVGDNLDMSVITDICTKQSGNSAFGSNVLAIAVQSLIQHVPVDMLEAASSQEIFDAALSVDEMTADTIQDIAFKLAETLRSAFTVMEDCVIPSAQEVVNDINARLSQYSVDAADPSQRVTLFDWGVLQTEDVIYAILTTCRDASDVEIKPDGTPSSERFIDLCFGRTYMYPVDILYGDSATELDAVLMQVGGSPSGMVQIRDFMTKSHRFSSFMWDAKQSLSRGDCTLMMQAVDLFSEAYISITNFKRAISTTPDLVIRDERIYSNLDAILNGLSLALGAVEVIRRRFQETLVFSTSGDYTSNTGVRIDLNADAYAAIQDQVSVEGIINIVRYLYSYKQTVPKTGLSIAKALSVVENANMWAADTQQISERSQEIEDRIVMRQQVENALLAWVVDFSRLQAVSIVTDTVRLQIQAVARKAAADNVALIDLVTEFIVKMSNTTALSMLYASMKANVAQPSMQMNMIASTECMIDQINRITLAAA